MRIDKQAYRFDIGGAMDPRELQTLLRQAHWAAQRDLKSIEILLAANPVRVAVFFHGELVGFGRAITDGLFRAHLDDIVVDNAHRGKGIGAGIVRSLIEQLSIVEAIYLNTEPDMEGFYSKCGFDRFNGVTLQRAITGKNAANY
jgi:GNAT superfamily N-acetyltransferase